MYTLYFMVAIPLVLIFLVQDIRVSGVRHLPVNKGVSVCVQVKREGLMVWHRNSIGILVQRLLFTIFFLISVCVFWANMGDEDVELGETILKTSIPLTCVVLVVCLKVSSRLINNCLALFLLTELALLSILLIDRARFY